MVHFRTNPVFALAPASSSAAAARTKPSERARIEPKISGEAKVSQRIPTVGAALRRGVRRIQRQEPPHGGIVAENRRGMDIARGQTRGARANRFRAIQGARGVPSLARDARGSDEIGQRIW